MGPVFSPMLPNMYFPIHTIFITRPTGPLQSSLLVVHYCHVGERPELVYSTYRKRIYIQASINQAEAHACPSSRVGSASSQTGASLRRTRHARTKNSWVRRSSSYKMMRQIMRLVAMCGRCVTDTFLPPFPRIFFVNTVTTQV